MKKKKKDELKLIRSIKYSVNETKRVKKKFKKNNHSIFLKKFLILIIFIFFLFYYYYIYIGKNIFKRKSKNENFRLNDNENNKIGNKNNIISNIDFINIDLSK